ncbi:MAG: hypothetical protein QM638_12845 [Nocardioides sp.]|uniref:hypothetical protein n=1 Tax=Nocardioides sp. TaxID=35761 RepID=UPI0039E70D36
MDDPAGQGLSPGEPGEPAADYLIAATADVGGLELATLDLRHVPMFAGLRRPFEVDA